MPAPSVRLLLVVSLLAFAGACRQSAPSVSAPLVDRSASRLIYAEQIGDTSTIWSVAPDEPDGRRALARIHHDSGWGVRASLSPDGSRIAYLAAPPGSRDPDHDAVLTLVDPRGQRSARLAGGLDLRATPVWWPREQRLVVQRVGVDAQATLVSVSFRGGDLRPLATAEHGHRLYAVGEAGGGAMMIADLSSAGTWLRRIAPGDAVEARIFLTSGPARAFTLSPDGGALAYLRLEGRDGGVRYRAWRVSLGDGAIAAVRTETSRLEDTGVAWAAAGRLLISATTNGGGGLLLGASTDEDRPQAVGFDALGPAAPDGRWLALRAFQGGTADAPGAESLTAVAADGRRVVLARAGVALGWSAG